MRDLCTLLGYTLVLFLFFLLSMLQTYCLTATVRYLRELCTLLGLNPLF